MDELKKASLRGGDHHLSDIELKYEYKNKSKRGRHKLRRSDRSNFYDLDDPNDDDEDSGEIDSRDVLNCLGGYCNCTEEEHFAKEEYLYDYTVAEYKSNH